MNFDTFNSLLGKQNATPSKQKICLVRGENNTVYDASGRAYIDFCSGSGENVLGYSHPLLIEAVTSQAKKLICVGDDFYNEIYDELRHSLIENTVFDKVLFDCSGTAAFAHSIKLICNYYKAKGKSKKILVVADSIRALSYGAAYESRSIHQNQMLKFTPPNDFEGFRKNLTEDIGAVVLETFQTENGLSITKHDFLLQAYVHSKSHGALLIMNEFISGVGRTGQMFSYQYSGINPDMALLSKGLGGGLPISALLSRGELAYSIAKSSDSFSSSFLTSLTASKVVLSELKSGLLERIVNVGNYFKAKLFKLSKYEFVREIRGTGLILGIDLDQRVSSAEVSALAAKEGILISPSVQKNTLLFLPPYTITKQEIDIAVDVIAKIFSRVL